MLVVANTQEVWRRPVTVSVFTVATQLPGGKVTPIHPGIEVGTEFRYNKSDKNQWLQTVKVGGYYHKYSQTAIQVYSELNYRRKIVQKLRGDFKLGAGYLYAIPDLQTFILEDGTYKKKSNPGRSQLMVSTALGVRYRLSHSNDAPQLFMHIQSFLQMPFIKSYVPVLPNTALHMGVSWPFFKTKN
jgi:hypothetical protein